MKPSEHKFLLPESEIDLLGTTNQHKDHLHKPSSCVTSRTLLYIELVHIVLFGLIWFIWRLMTPSSAEKTPLIQSYDDLVSRVVKITFPEEDFVNNTLSNPSADALWSSITYGANNGFVSLPTEFITHYSLPVTNLPTALDEHVYQLNVFHQLHCLRNIRTWVNKQIQLPAVVDLESQEFQHTLHCIDFLRQVLECHADMTLMGTRLDPTLKGYGPRQCRDFGKVKDWVAANRWETEKYD